MEGTCASERANVRHSHVFGTGATHCHCHKLLSVLLRSEAETRHRVLRQMYKQLELLGLIPVLPRLHRAARVGMLVCSSWQRGRAEKTEGVAVGFLHTAERMRCACWGLSSTGKWRMRQSIRVEVFHATTWYPMRHGSTRRDWSSKWRIKRRQSWESRLPSGTATLIRR